MTVSGRRVALLGLAAGALAVGGYYAFRPTDESRIRTQLGRLEKALRITDADMQTNPIGRLAHVSGEFEAIFDPAVRVSVPELTTLQSGRRELAMLVAGAPKSVRTFDVDFGKITIKIDDTASAALVGAVAEVKAVDREGKKRQDKRAVDFRFARQDGDWIITTLTVWPKDDAAPD